MRIDYEWTDADPRYTLGPGFVVMRQSDGIRRWDAVYQGVPNPTVGFLAVGDSICSWSRVRPETTLTRVNCDLTPEPGAFLDTSVISALLFKTGDALQRSLPRRDIAGRTADCYDTEQGAIACVDSETHGLLFFSGKHPETGENQTIEAISFDETAPAPLTFDPPDRGVDVPPESIHLPPEFELGPFDPPR